VNADEIGFAERLLERNVLDPVFFAGKAAGVAQVVDLLDRFDEGVIFVRRVITKNIYSLL
jgi:hypothetical protein